MWLWCWCCSTARSVCYWTSLLPLHHKFFCLLIWIVQQDDGLLQIEWWRNGNLLGKNKTITIRRVNAMNHGGYVCVGRNDYGTVNKTIDLIVLSKQMIDFSIKFKAWKLVFLSFYDQLLLAKPRFSVQNDRPHSETILIRLGENITLMCPFENFAQFQWFKDSIPFNNETINIDIRNISRTDQGLVLRNVFSF